MPALCELAQQGASCFRAKTVTPTITLPAHASLLRGVDPNVHGIMDNAPTDVPSEWPSFLQVARNAGRRTAAATSWSPMDRLLEKSATSERFFLDGGYDAAEDARITNQGVALLSGNPDVTFVYLIAPDLAGHDAGWGSPAYLDALTTSDAALHQLAQAAGPDCAVVVTTDHGGHDNSHHLGTTLDSQTFVVIRSNQVGSATGWRKASLLDIAPTVAALNGFEPAATWTGHSLLGSERANVDLLLDDVLAMHEHSYGETLSMYEHALQATASAEAAGGPAELVAAALLHDVGHLDADAGEWGVPDHARLAAQRLQQILPTSVVEPIRLHVEAKRYLVAAEPTYRDQLSAASIASLEQQGGAHSALEVQAFADTAFASDAVKLRRFDDSGKTQPESVPGRAELAEKYGPLLQALLDQPHRSSTWLRDACICAECRDLSSGQHLLDATDLEGWVHQAAGVIRHHTGQSHATQVPPTDPISPSDASPAPGFEPIAELERHDAREPLGSFASHLTRTGIAMATDLSPAPGQVLQFAERLGFVRHTNYGALFDVRFVPEPNNLAYSSVGLPLHTDNPYRDPVPTVQLLHCLAPADEGGSSQFVDGWAAAERLRLRDEGAFDLLSTTMVSFQFADSIVDLIARKPIIECSPDGVVHTIRVNHRSMVTPRPAAHTARFYRAYRSFVDELNRPEFVRHLTLGAGEVVAFDNRRMLHGRSGFSSTSERHLQGCYIDMDAVQSVARRHHLR